MRGEYPELTKGQLKRMESPPHAWGIQKSRIADLAGNRITPTCVGNTLFLFRQAMFFENHPHMRGEYTKEIPSNRRFDFRPRPFFISSGFVPLVYPINNDLT